jgi:DNA-binding MarR family transcriptional regulator
VLTPKGRIYRDILAEVFRYRARLLEGAEPVSASVGLTGARWQLLGAIEHQPAPVAHVARGLGLTRQSVQETADALARDGLIAFVDNPHHKRARLMTPTPRAVRLLEELRPRELQFANRMGARHSLAALRATHDVLRASREVIEARHRSTDA